MPVALCKGGRPLAVLSPPKWFLWGGTRVPPRVIWLLYRVDQASGVVPQSHPREGAVELLQTPHRSRAPSWWHGEAKWIDPQFPLGCLQGCQVGWYRESLQKSSVCPSWDSPDPWVGRRVLLHPGGQKGPPPNKSETVPMEVCGEGETAVSQGGGDAPLGCKQVSWEEKVQVEEERKSKDDPKRGLPLLPLKNTTSTATATAPAAPSTSDGGFIMVRGWKSRDKRPRDPSKDPTPQWRPSKASQSPLPFLLRSESERVANIHTIFKVAFGQDRPSSEWVYDCLEVFFPRKTVEHLVYFSNVLCLSISEFHLTSTCTPPGMCAPVLPPVVEAELPPLETYLHEGELGTQDVRIHCIAVIKRLGVWLHQVDMTTRYNESRANSPCFNDHKLGALLDFFLVL